MFEYLRSWREIREQRKELRAEQKKKQAIVDLAIADRRDPCDALLEYDYDRSRVNESEKVQEIHLSILKSYRAWRGVNIDVVPRTKTVRECYLFASSVLDAEKNMQ